MKEAIQAPSLEYQPMVEPLPEWQPEGYELALTKAQKEAIRIRDENKCQFPSHLNGHKHECGGKLEIHHILPLGFMKELHANADYPENVLLICQHGHDLIHKDVAYARKHWTPKSDAFLKVQQGHQKALEERRPYWNTEYDRPMSVMAVRNTQRAESKGWRWPKAKREFFDEETGEIYKYSEVKQ